MSWLDLHMHSNISNDGEYSPEALMGLCHHAGLKIVALTDHNSVRGVAEAIRYGNQYGIEVIPAIEMDCTFSGHNLHLLGYGISIPNPRLLDIERDVKKLERSASSVMIEKVTTLGIFFNVGNVMKLAVEGVVTGEMIAEVALDDQRNRSNPLISPYFSGGSRSDNPFVNFYWDFCSINKPAYAPIEYRPLEEAVEVIIESGGVPVLAHPQKNIGFDEEVLIDIIGQGVKGIEVYSSYHDMIAIQYYEKMAEKHDLLKTVGSDFRGKTKPSIKLGHLGCHSAEQALHDMLEKELIMQ
jgi:predicted metal-dependent phosphoesterase TrpH